MPTEADLKGNPTIGGSKGTVAAGVSPDELEADLGDSTIEGDTENDNNAQSGIDKRAAQSRHGTDRERPDRPRRR